jgi:hypothetical protein
MTPESIVDDTFDPENANALRDRLDGANTKCVAGIPQHISEGHSIFD